MPVVIVTDSADATCDIGRRLASVLRAGDVVILAGELGAGKTTLTRGLGAALGARGDVTSPTFVISRVHPAGTGTCGLVHVDAYRLGSAGELDDLDVDAFTDGAVTVVEWGDGLAEALSPDRLRVHLSRRGDSARGDDDSAAQRRVITVTAIGDRWAHVRLEAALGLAGDPPVASHVSTERIG